MEWLEHDEAPRDALPKWASAGGDVLDGKPYRVTVRPEGLVLRRSRGVSAVRWEELLVPIRLENPRRLLVAAARRPPRPPWFELGGRDVAKIEQAVQSRLDSLDSRGYRQRRRQRAVRTPNEILTAVLSNQPLPGAVEVPIATPSFVWSAVIGGTVGGVTLAFYGMVAGPTGMLVLGGLGALGGAGLVSGVECLQKRRAGRVLVLTPDGFVGGLDGRSVRAIPWNRVGRFVDGVDGAGRRALEVFDHERRRLARVDARWFGAPLGVIVAVAEAYRRRASEGA